MRRNRFWLGGLAACLALALAGFADHKEGHKKPGGGGGGKVSLISTFRDLGDLLSPDRLMSDCKMGNCPYIDKVDNVGTNIDTLGDFSLRLTSKGNQPADRTLFLDFSDCASLDEVPPKKCPSFTVDDGFTGVGFSGPGNMFTSGVNLREMGMDETSDGLTLKMSFKPVDSDFAWKLFFDPSNLDCPPLGSLSVSSFVSVIRTDADTWEIEAGQDAVACLERRKETRGSDFIFKGLYHMPFKILVQKK